VGFGARPWPSALAPAALAANNCGVNEGVSVATESLPQCNFAEAERRWQRAWAERGCFRVADAPTDNKPKYYVPEITS
jgi:hypothetical protein